MVFRYSKRARTFFTYYVPSEATLLAIPPGQTPMCGVAYSCSYVLLVRQQYFEPMDLAQLWDLMADILWPFRVFFFTFRKDRGLTYVGRFLHL